MQITKLITLYIDSVSILILSSNGFHHILLIAQSTSLHQITVCLLLLYIQAFVRVQLLILYFFLCALVLCQPSLIYTLSCTIYVLITCNRRCLPTKIISKLRFSMQTCVSDIKALATANIFNTYDDKTQCVPVSSTEWASQKRTYFDHSC